MSYSTKHHNVQFTVSYCAAAGSCEDVRVEGVRGLVEIGRGPARVEGTGRGPVFPHTHIGIPNPLSPQRPTFRDSQSSFEDLEEECLEFSTEIPRSC